MAMLKVRFDTPLHGGMAIQIATCDQSRSLEVSHVPDHSLDRLVSALLRLLQGSPRETVEWSLEPEYSEWEFSHVGEIVELKIATKIGPQSEFAFSVKAQVILHRIIKRTMRLVGR